MGFKTKEILVSRFVYSNFNYCPLVWHFCRSKSMKNLGKIQARALKILYNDFDSDNLTLLNKHNKATMAVQRLLNLALEVFKTINHLNPEYMKEIFHKSTLLTHRPLNLQVNQNNTTKYGIKSLRTLGLHI